MNIRSDRSGAPVSAARRQMLTAAALGAGAAVLPAGSAFAAIGSAAPSLMLGYCSHGSLSKLGASAPLVDSVAVRPAGAQEYMLRVVGAQTHLPLAFGAAYGTTALHRFWQVWKEGSLLQRSAPIAIHWNAAQANALPLAVEYGGASLAADITAQAGLYAVMLPLPTQRAPSWSQVALKPQSNGGVEYRLYSRLTGGEVPVAYALFDVAKVD